VTAAALTAGQYAVIAIVLAASAVLGLIARRATAGERTEPEVVRTWQHRSKGTITGVLVSEDETWADVRVVGEHKIPWLSQMNRDRGPVLDGEVMTLRKSFMTEDTAGERG
jgi:hypothetical protein